MKKRALLELLAVKGYKETANNVYEREIDKTVIKVLVKNGEKLFGVYMSNYANKKASKRAESEYEYFRGLL